MTGYALWVFAAATMAALSFGEGHWFGVALWTANALLALSCIRREEGGR